MAQHLAAMTNGLPTARTTHRAGFLCVLVWCKACRRRGPADLQAVIDSGPRGRAAEGICAFRCTRCRTSHHTDSVVMAKFACRVQVVGQESVRRA
jgi:hypothetical protein